VEQDEVLAILGAVEVTGTRLWVAGGWGVDALVGRQTRAHRDLDLLVDSQRLGECLALLAARCYAVETDWLSVRVEVVAAGRGLGGRAPGAAGSGMGVVRRRPRSGASPRWDPTSPPDAWPPATVVEQRAPANVDRDPQVTLRPQQARSKPVDQQTRLPVSERSSG